MAALDILYPKSPLIFTAHAKEKNNPVNLKKKSISSCIKHSKEHKKS